MKDPRNRPETYMYPKVEHGLMMKKNMFFVSHGDSSVRDVCFTELSQKELTNTYTNSHTCKDYD